MENSIDSEKYRTERLRCLQEKYPEVDPPAVTKAKEMISDYCKKKKDANAEKARLRSQLPVYDLCPQCYYGHEKRSFLIAVPSPEPDRFDLMRCRACGYSESRGR